MNIRRIIRGSVLSLILLTIVVSALSYWSNLSPPENAATSEGHLQETEHVATSNSSKDHFENLESQDNTSDEILIQIAGESIPIKLEDLDLNPFALPDKSAEYLYEKLKDRALSGEAVAARLLSDLITECNETFVDESLHTQALKRLVENNEYPSANPRHAGTKVPLDMVGQVESYFDKQFNRCKGLTEAQRGEASKWATVAADAGDFLGLEQLIRQQDTLGIEKLRLMEKQWDDYGFFDSTIGLATVLSDYGKFADFEGIETDNVKAYAYFLVGSKLSVAAAERNGSISTDINQMRVDHDAYEALLTSHLGPDEHLAAEQLAIEMIESNSNCCTVDPRQGVRITLSDSQ